MLKQESAFLLCHPLSPALPEGTQPWVYKLLSRGESALYVPGKREVVCLSAISLTGQFVLWRWGIHLILLEIRKVIVLLLWVQMHKREQEGVQNPTSGKLPGSTGSIN